jgi:hypothetical protein
MPPPEIVNTDNIPLYISNLSGLGIFEIRRGTYLTADNAYDDLISYAKETFKFPDTMTVENVVRTVTYSRHVISRLPYGVAFMNACS